MDVVGVPWFLLGQFSKVCQGSEADGSVTPLCSGWSSRRAASLASFSRTWNLSKAAVDCIREVIQALKNPSRHFCTPVLTRQHETFLQSSSRIYNVPVMWVQLSLEKCPASFLCFLFKALGDSYLSAIKPQFFHKESLSFYSLLPQRNHPLSSASKGLASLAPHDDVCGINHWMILLQRSARYNIKIIPANSLLK